MGSIQALGHTDSLVSENLDTCYHNFVKGQSVSEVFRSQKVEEESKEIDIKAIVAREAIVRYCCRGEEFFQALERSKQQLMVLPACLLFILIVK